MNDVDDSELDRERRARREAEQIAARAIRELERSHVDLEQFASIASHDLQEPLRKVRTFTQRVIDTESDNLSEQGRDYLDRANHAGARMQTLIQDLLAYARVSTRGRPFAPVDLARVTREVLGDLEVAIERCGATVEVGSLPTVDADATQMRQLIENLLGNALKFRDPDRAPHVAIEGAPGEAAAVAVAVRDNGIGFDPQYRDRIFGVFERLHGRSEYDGTGIGLALCRRIAERHGGAVSADAVPGEGAVFRVELPRHHAAEAIAEPAG